MNNTKCYKPSLAEGIERQGVSYFPPSVQQDVGDDGGRPHHAGSNNYLGLTTGCSRQASCPGDSTAGCSGSSSSTAPSRCIWSWRRN